MTPTNDAPVTVEQAQTWLSFQDGPCPLCLGRYHHAPECSYAPWNMEQQALAKHMVARLMKEADVPDYRAGDGTDWCQIDAKFLREVADVLAALASSPAGDGVSLQEALKQVRQYVERKSCDAFDDREDKLLAVIDAALARPRAAAGLTSSPPPRR